MKRRALFALVLAACSSPLTIATTREFVVEEDAAGVDSGVNSDASGIGPTSTDAGEDATASIQSIEEEAGSDARNEQ